MILKGEKLNNHGPKFAKNEVTKTSANSLIYIVVRFASITRLRLSKIVVKDTLSSDLINSSYFDLNKSALSLGCIFL